MNGGKDIDIVWCVAGISTPMLWTDEAALAACRRNMDVNFWGAAELSHAVLRAWQRPDAPPSKEPRHLVFTASVVAFFAVAGYGPYTPSKWALRGLVDTLAQEAMLYPAQPVRVSIVYPGTILSPGYERENRTKPDVTLELEKSDPKLTPDETAAKAIAGPAGRAALCHCDVHGRDVPPRRHGRVDSEQLGARYVGRLDYVHRLVVRLVVGSWRDKGLCQEERPSLDIFQEELKARRA